MIELIFSVSGLVISIISLIVSLYNHFKRLKDEKFRAKHSISSVSAVDSVPTKLGITYVEMTITNESSLPLPIIEALLRVKINNVTIKDADVIDGNTIESNAHRFDTLISTHTETAGSEVTRTFEHKSNGLPITVAPKDSKHFILAFPTPYVLGLNKHHNLYLELTSHEPNKIIIKNEELSQKAISMHRFLQERLREA